MKTTNSISIANEEIKVQVPPRDSMKITEEIVVTGRIGDFIMLPPNNKIILKKEAEVSVNGDSFRILEDTFTDLNQITVTVPSPSGSPDTTVTVGGAVQLAGTEEDVTLTVPEGLTVTVPSPPVQVGLETPDIIITIPNVGPVALSNDVEVTIPGGTAVSLSLGNSVSPTLVVPVIEPGRCQYRGFISLPDNTSITLPGGTQAVANIPPNSEPVQLGAEIPELTLDIFSEKEIFLILPVGTWIKKDVPEFVNDNPLSVTANKNQTIIVELAVGDQQDNNFRFPETKESTCTIMLCSNYAEVIVNNKPKDFRTGNKNKAYEVLFPRGNGVLNIKYDVFAGKYRVNITGTKATFEPKKGIGGPVKS